MKRLKKRRWLNEVIIIIAVYMISILFQHPYTAYAATYYWPVDTKYNITCGFYGYTGHNGVDFAVPIGTPVYASVGGKATVVDRGCLGSHRDGGKPECPKKESCDAWKNGGNNGSYGNYIKITQSDGMVSYYCHLKTGIPISDGVTVSAGQLIGYSGCAGNTTGPHLHFEIRKNGTRLNPEEYLTRSNVSNSDSCNCSDSYAGNYTVTTSQLPLTIRSGHGGSYGKVGSIPKGTTVYVSKANGSWAHVTYNGVSGYCSMEYLSKQEPAVEEGWVDIGTGFYARMINASYYKFLTDSNDDVRTYSENGNSNQVWRFDRNSDGSYQIQNVASGKVLDVSNAGSDNGTNVWVCDSNHTEAQKWYIYGSQWNYSLRPGCAPKCRLDVQDGFQGENGNIWIYEKNDSAAQKFTIQKTGDGTIQAQNVGDDFYAYIINTAAWKHLTSDGNNVTMRNMTGKAEQVWHFQKRSDDNSYKIVSCLDGKILDVTNLGTEDGTNLGVCGNNDSNAQRWYVYGESGAYYFRARCGELVIDIPGGSTADGENVHMWTYNGGTAQKFQIWKVIMCNGVSLDHSNETLLGIGTTLQLTGTVSPADASYRWISWSSDNTSVATVDSNGLVTAVGEGTATITARTQDGSNVSATCQITVLQDQNVGDDFYAYITNTAAGKHLTNDGINVSMRSDTGKADQVWHFQRQSDNSYKIISCLNGRNLDVYGAGTTDGVNLQVHWDNGNKAQYWYICGIPNAYYFRALCGELVIDIPNGSTADGENAWMWTYNGESAQQFSIQKVNMCSGVTLNCSNKTLLGIGATTQLTGAVLPADATNKALFWSSSNTAVATVDSNGLVTAVGEGTATITARTQDGSNVSATCQITVLQDQNVGDDFYAYITNTAAGKHLTNDGINVSMRSDTGKADQVWHFQRQSDNSYKVISCLNGKILDVANAGRVDGTNLDVYESNETWAQRWYICGEQGSYCFRAQCGELVIDIPNDSTENGENVWMWTYNGGSAQQFSIQKMNICSGVTLNYSNKTLSKIGATIQLKGTVLPAEATNKMLLWSSSNTAVATVDSNGLVTAVGAGSATITATTQDGSNISATCEIAVCELLTVTGKASLSEVIAGNSVTITATASGGKAGYTYSFLIHNLETDKWFRVAEFGDSKQYIWIASGSGKREFFAEAKDSAGTVVRSEAIKVTVKAKSTPLSISGKVSTSEVTFGKTVTIHANATGGTGDYTYSFLIHNLENDSWYRWAFDKSAEHVWTANGSGSREFFAEVKDAAGTVVRSEAMKVTVKSEQIPLAITGKVSASQVAEGNTVTLSSSATGGAGSYTYSFLIHNLENDSWYRWAFDKSAEHVWTASGSGSREFFVEVKDAAGTVVRSAAMKVTVDSGSNTEPLRILASADKTQVTTGTAVTISALAVGGSGSYTYSFLVHNLENDSWYRFGDFAEAFSYTWTAGDAGTREFFAEAKDSNGTVVRSSAVIVTVK